MMGYSSYEPTFSDLFDAFDLYESIGFPTNKLVIYYDSCPCIISEMNYNHFKARAKSGVVPYSIPEVDKSNFCKNCTGERLPHSYVDGVTYNLVYISFLLNYIGKPNIFTIADSIYSKKYEMNRNIFPNNRFENFIVSISKLTFVKKSLIMLNIEYINRILIDSLSTELRERYSEDFARYDEIERNFSLIARDFNWSFNSLLSIKNDRNLGKSLDSLYNYFLNAISKVYFSIYLDFLFERNGEVILNDFNHLPKINKRYEVDESHFYPVQKVFTLRNFITLSDWGWDLPITLFFTKILFKENEYIDGSFEKGFLSLSDDEYNFIAFFLKRYLYSGKFNEDQRDLLNDVIKIWSNDRNDLYFKLDRAVDAIKSLD